MSQDEIHADEVLRREARAFRESVRTAALATADADGVPHASSAPYVADEQENIYVYVSALAGHTGNLRATGRASVLFLEKEGAARNPFARRRLTYECRVTAIARDCPRWNELLDRFACEFGTIMDTLRALMDFQLFCLEPVAATYVRGFGQTFELSGPGLSQVSPVNPAAQAARAPVATVEQVLSFWYGQSMRDCWFKSTPELDRQILERFGNTHRSAAEGRLDHWARTPEGALALVIVLDQFPLNMYRGRPESFATEGSARQVAVHAIDAGFDGAMDAEQKIFLYMPLMHREDIADQDRAVALFEAAGLEHNLKWARHHREIVRRFGRFPHRNAILGRASTPDELEYLNSRDAFLG
ncbi:MAG: DUF924 family protein [Gammaproteobacteria bacterium]